MALILNIDTATATASVCLAKEGKVLQYLNNNQQQDHAAWIQPAIQQLYADAGIELQETDAVAVSNGPGSYTGLRVGLSTAKGLCYVLQKPLITVNTLELMAWSARMLTKAWLCPMIDARRMEVYTALYTNEIKLILQPTAMILDMQSFATTLAEQNILFFGNGSGKFETICAHPNALFMQVESTASNLAEKSYVMYLSEVFADIAYSEPFYTKDFFTTAKKLI
jgi:tRNA threonylcarbamoyladenosine biosynthesis protein TsaB